MKQFLRTITEQMHSAREFQLRAEKTNKILAICKVS